MVEELKIEVCSLVLTATKQRQTKDCKHGTGTTHTHVMKILMANGWRGGLLVLVAKNKTQWIKQQQETTDHIIGIRHLILTNYSHKYTFPLLWNLIVTSRQIDLNWGPLANTNITHYKRGRSQLHWGSHIFTTAWKIVGKFLLLCLHATDDPYWIGGVATVMVEWFAYSPQNLPRSDKPPPQKAFCRRLACTWYGTAVYVYSTIIYILHIPLYICTWYAKNLVPPDRGKKFHIFWEND